MADLFSDTASDTATSPRRFRASLRPSRLAQTLREARQDSRLGLEDVAEQTGIRRSHLEALEAGRFFELPGDAHGRTFVRRYAQAVGLDPARALILYAQERRNLRTADHPAGRAGEPERPAAVGTAVGTAVGAEVPPQVGRIVRLCASLLLVAAAIWLALRAFDGALAPTQAGPTQTEQTRAAPEALENVPVGAAAVGKAAAQPPVPAVSAMILLSLRTTPPGAEISIDGYHFGQSPIVDAPVRAGNRTLKVERSGYGTFERTLELNQDRRLTITLAPGGAGEATLRLTPTPAAPTDVPVVPAETTQTPAAQTRVVVSVTAEAWLEVYRGSERGGERLVYETAQPGDVYTLTAPVYVFSGNAGGVSVARGDAPARPLGTPGAVVGQAYRQP